MSSTRTILFAGGGSGGHISPGLAIAERLKRIAPESRSIFICSDRAIDREMLREAEAFFIPVPALPPSTKPIAAMRFVHRYFQTRQIVREVIETERVTHVVALGGFVAAPAVAAARRRVPITLVNLDCPPGRANRMMARKCNRVLTAIDLPMMPKFAHKTVGVPIRLRALMPGKAEACRRKLGLDPQLPTLLVTGASQGAGSINALMIELAATQPKVFDNWQVYHITGRGAADEVRSAYKAANVRAIVCEFLSHMGLAWGAADLAISRAGASSVAEIAVNAVPAIFLPYPHHKDNHQKHNAQPLVDLGGAVMIDDVIDAKANAAAIVPVLESLLRDDAKRKDMRAKLAARRGPDAAELIAKMVL